jgi:hypothetical protein
MPSEKQKKDWGDLHGVSLTLDFLFLTAPSDFIGLDLYLRSSFSFYMTFMFMFEASDYFQWFLVGYDTCVSGYGITLHCISFK